MSVEYTLTDARLRSLKAAVTRAQNKQDWRAVIAACEKADRTFREQGYPDCWSDFERHKGDAELSLKFNYLLIDKGCW
jgi:hypothetical protein